MALQAKNVCLSYAHCSANVKGLVLLGSFAVQQQSETSDLDILFLLSTGASIKEYQEELSNIFKKVVLEAQNESADKNHVIISYECDLLSEDKTIIYVSIIQNTDTKRKKILKIDCGHTFDIMDKLKYIIGSEIKLSHLSHAILIDYYQDKNITTKYIVNKENITQGDIYKHVYVALTSSDPYAHAGLKDNDPLFLIHNFVEIFDNACDSFIKGDQYRTEFHMFILRHRLICLQLLSNGEKEHIYLPKMAYDRTSKITIANSDVFQTFLNLLLSFQLLKIGGFKKIPVEKFNNWCRFLQCRLEDLYESQGQADVEESFEFLCKKVKNEIAEKKS